MRAFPSMLLWLCFPFLPRVAMAALVPSLWPPTCPVGAWPIVVCGCTSCTCLKRLPCSQKCYDGRCNDAWRAEKSKGTIGVCLYPLPFLSAMTSHIIGFLGIQDYAVFATLSMGQGPGQVSQGGLRGQTWAARCGSGSKGPELLPSSKKKN